MYKEMHIKQMLNLRNNIDNAIVEYKKEHSKSCYNDIIIYLGAKEDTTLKFFGGEDFGFNEETCRFTYCGHDIYVVDLESYIHVVEKGE